LVYFINYFTFVPLNTVMETKNDNLSAQESLNLISSMIQQAKGNMRKSSFYFLLWGWTVAIANLGVYILIKFTDVSNPFLMFGITIPSAIISVVYGARQEKQKIAPTILDSINKWLWIGFGITCFIFAFFGQRMSWQINPVIITMCAVPTFISGIMLRFKPLMIGGVIFWLSGVILFLVPAETQFLLAAIAVILGYLIPGYMLKKSEV
jgi:Flp pilus assembly protein TadB